MSSPKRGLLWKILYTLVKAICDGDRFVLERVDIEEVTSQSLAYVQKLPWIYSIAARLTLLFFEFAIWPWTPKWRSFSSLAQEKRLAYLADWSESNLYLKRIAAKLLFSICLSHLYSQRTLLEGIGFGQALQARAAYAVPPDVAAAEEWLKLKLPESP